MKPVLLDLFCGAGGAAKGYQQAGFRVIGVDIEPQPNYCGDEFVWADALTLRKAAAGETPGTWYVTLFAGFPAFLGEIDGIHASPPCQRWSNATPDASKHPDLITPLRPLLQATGLPYVIENVPGAPLVDPVRLCGSSVGLPLHRHRLFESNVRLMVPPCAHGQLEAKFDVYEHGHWYKGSTVKVYGSGGGKANEHWAEAMGIDWMTPAELVEAIPPRYTELLGLQLRQQLERVAA